jgi:hypothetical protein
LIDTSDWSRCFTETLTKETEMSHKKMNLVTVTRCFGRTSKQIKPFIEASQALGPVFVVVNSTKDQAGMLNHLNEHHPDVGIDNTTGDNLTAALNIGFWKAVALGAEYILFASDSFPPTKDQVASLLTQMDEHTLVAGARFGQHTFQTGEHKINGLNTPWNTFAIWNVDLLCKWAGGFPVSGTYPQNPKLGGVEEIDAIVLAQTNAAEAGVKLSAKVKDVPNFVDTWTMKGWTEEQITTHEEKMASKVSRPAARGLTSGKVIHVST